MSMVTGGVLYRPHFIKRNLNIEYFDSHHLYREMQNRCITPSFLLLNQIYNICHQLMHIISNYVILHASNRRSK